MKKILLLLVSAVLISSCTLTGEDELPKDCGCNRIVEVSSFYMADRQRNYQWQNNKPQKGSCY